MRAWFLLAIPLAGCGGQEPPSQPAQSIASWTYDGPPSGLSQECLTTPLPVDSTGEPDCVFIRAMYPPGTASAGGVAACQACSAPGEAPVPSAVSLASVSPDLAGYDCLCVVQAQPASWVCPPFGAFTGASPAAWCYLPSDLTCGPAPEATIKVSPAAIDGAVLYGACFPVGTLSVTESE